MNNSIENPFASAGTVISKDIFVGREQEITTIKERVLGRNYGNLAVVGIPKIGKSSLVSYVFEQCKDFLWDEYRYIVVDYTFKSNTNRESVDALESRDVFLSLASRVYQFLKRHEQLQLLEDLQEYYDVITRDNVRWSEFEQNLLYFFEEIIYSKLRVIYCIDEFDYSKDTLGETEYQLLRELSYRNSNQIAIVTTSRRSIYDIEHYSGGGSNFYGTFENVYLKPFSLEEHKKQCALLPNISEELLNVLYKKHGGHPYLNAINLRNVFNGQSIDDSLITSNQDTLRYYDDLFYVLEKDDLADKVDMLYCGFVDGVSETQEDYILNCYGIFKEGADGYFDPYSEIFETILRERYRKNSFSLIWPEAERSIRKAITYAMTEEFGDESILSWSEELSSIPKIPKERLKKWKQQLDKERRLFKSRASDNIIDQLYPVDYLVFFDCFWSKYLSKIFGFSLEYWKDNLDFIATKVRNPIMHSRKKLLTADEEGRAKLICEQITSCVKKIDL